MYDRVLRRLEPLSGYSTGTAPLPGTPSDFPTPSRVRVSSFVGPASASASASAAAKLSRRVSSEHAGHIAPPLVTGPPPSRLPPAASTGTCSTLTPVASGEAGPLCDEAETATLQLGEPGTAAAESEWSSTHSLTCAPHGANDDSSHGTTSTLFQNSTDMWVRAAGVSAAAHRRSHSSGPCNATASASLHVQPQGVYSQSFGVRRRSESGQGQRIKKVPVCSRLHPSALPSVPLSSSSTCAGDVPKTAHDGTDGQPEFVGNTHWIHASPWQCPAHSSVQPCGYGASLCSVPRVCTVS
jgi:hypothetical protein